ncbi:MAG: dipeptidase [Beijerinckiaceae bacterium]
MTATVDKVLAHVDAGLDQALGRLFAFLRIPSISTDSAFGKDTERAARWLADDLASIGFDAQPRKTPGAPVVVGRQAGSAGRHALFYGHYDVQPVDPLNLWHSDPFDPKIVEIAKGRKAIVARGACDDKGQVMTFVEACRAWKAVTGALPLGITMMIEGEEESGSANLPAFVKANRKELQADLCLVCDTGMWDRKTPAITTSLRGMVYQEIIIRAANRDLHSGLYGGAAQNPIHILARICASLHDKNGKIMVPGFYEGVKNLPRAVKADLEKLKLTEKEFLGPIGLKKSAGEKGRLLLEQISTRPTCDVNGIWGGYTGEGTKTVIASEAHAKVSFRLVGDQNPAKIAKSFQAFVRAQVPDDCKVEFLSHNVSPAIQLPFDSPDLLRTREALTKEWGRKAVMVGSGGSIPIVGDFKKTLGLDSLLVGFGLEDDRVHSPNEKYDLTSFHKGIRSWVRILAALGD